MLSGHCTEALSTQANVTISGSSAKLIKNGIAPLPFPLPALLKQYWYIKRGEGHGEGTCSILCNVRVARRRRKGCRPSVMSFFPPNGLLALNPTRFCKTAVDPWG